MDLHCSQSFRTHHTEAHLGYVLTHYKCLAAPETETSDASDHSYVKQILKCHLVVQNPLLKYLFCILTGKP